MAAEPNIYQNQERHDSIVVGHRHSRAELPVVVGEHEGSEQNKSGTCVTDHLEDENGEVFSIQGFIFARVPVKEKNKLEVFFFPYFEQVKILRLVTLPYVEASECKTQKA